MFQVVTTRKIARYTMYRKCSSRCIPIILSENKIFSHFSSTIIFFEMQFSFMNGLKNNKVLFLFSSTLLNEECIPSYRKRFYPTNIQKLVNFIFMGCTKSSQECCYSTLRNRSI